MEGLIMNALEQEYRDNVENSRVRDARRMFIVGAVGCMVVAGAFTCVDPGRGVYLILYACMHIAVALVRLILMMRARTTRVIAPVETDDVATTAIGYRDAALSTPRPVVSKDSVARFALSELA